MSGWAALALLLCACPAAKTQERPSVPTVPQKDLTKTSIEDLMDIEVSSVSKRQQTLSQTAAAVFVITQEDIRRSGARNIPDLLRIVPGLDVAEINGSTWAIGSRGLNQQFANKLLVMVDGRSVYSPTFSGVFWDTLDVPLFDIDRIEVIRGPGGTIWGANAVTGVISIFTKKAAATKGARVEAGGGNVQQGFGMVQYGDSIGQQTDYRIYANYFNQASLLDRTGQSGADGWHRLRSGFRIDSTLSKEDSLVVEGDLSVGREGELAFKLPAASSPGFVAVSEEINLGDGSLESTWNHVFSGGSDATLQFSYDQHRRGNPLNPELRNTYDLAFRHHFRAGDRHDVVWGLGYRDSLDQIGGSFTVAIEPPSRALQLFDGFIQDQIAVILGRLYLTAGTKLEHNDYTGMQAMPSIRASWSISDHQMGWVAVSEALRAPSRSNTNLVLNIGSFPGPGGVPVLLRLLGNPTLKDEQLLAYEAGYRSMLSRRLSIDFAAYFNHWDKVESTEPSSAFFEGTPSPPHIVQTLLFENLIYGESHGLEVAANWKVSDRWSVSSGFAFAREHFHNRPQSRDSQTVRFIEGNAPDFPFVVRSHFDLRHGMEWDVSGYYIDALSNQGPLANVEVPAYTRVDTQLTKNIGEGFSISVVGQNLARDHHLEFDDLNGSMQSGQVKRSAYARVVWRF